MPYKKSPDIEKKLLLVGTIFYWSALYIYVPTLSPYVKILEDSLTIVGLVVASYGFTQLLFRFPIGIWSDNTGRRKPYVLSGFIFSFISGIGLALSPNAWVLLIFRGLSGVAASMWVAFTILYSGYFRDAQATRAMSQISFYTGLAQMISTYAGGKIADVYGWIAPFYVGAGLSAIGILAILPISEEISKSKTIFSIQRLLAIASHKPLLVVSIITALSQFSVFITTYGFLPIYAHDIGASKSDLGALMFIIHFFQTLSMYLAGTIVAPRIGYKITVFTAYFAIALVTFATPYVHSVHILFIIHGLGALWRGLAYPLLMGLAIQGVPKEEKATAMGFYQAVYSAGMFIGPASGGLIGNYFGMQGIFFSAGFVYLLSALMSVCMLPKKA